jgi:hypothetical protein
MIKMLKSESKEMSLKILYNNPRPKIEDPINTIAK